jgi:hypothetical protein
MTAPPIRPTTRATRKLYHYTCQHGRLAIGSYGYVLPLWSWNPRAGARLGERWRPLAEVSWFTDLDSPWPPRALGLTRSTIRCDRTQYRYRVVDDRDVVPWLDSPYRREPLLLLERAGGALPRHWYVATKPVVVALDELPD